MRVFSPTPSVQIFGALLLHVTGGAWYILCGFMYIISSVAFLQCSSLHVVAPRCDVFADEALTLACGSSLVEEIHVHDTVQV